MADGKISIVFAKPDDSSTGTFRDISLSATEGVHVGQARFDVIMKTRPGLYALIILLFRVFDAGLATDSCFEGPAASDWAILDASSRSA